MINTLAANKANNSQTLLPVISENTDNAGESFKSLMEDMKAQTSMFSNSFSSNEVDIKPYSEKNTSVSYMEKNASSSYDYQEKTSYTEKNNTSPYVKRAKDNRYDEDRQAYEAVENKSYNNDNNVGRKNRKEENNIDGKNVFEKKDVKGLKEQAGIVLEKNPQEAGEVNITKEALKEKISIKDILLLLQTSSKGKTLEGAGKENVELEQLIEKLELSDVLKQALKDIIAGLSNLPEDEISNLNNYLNNASSNLELLNVNSLDDAAILSKVSEALMENSDESSLDSALNVLKERLEILTGKKAAETDSEEIKAEAETVSDENMKADNKKLSEIINNIASLIDKAVNEAENTGSSDEKITLAKDIVAVLKSAVNESKPLENVVEVSNETNRENISPLIENEADVENEAKLTTLENNNVAEEESNTLLTSDEAETAKIALDDDVLVEEKSTEAKQGTVKESVVENNTNKNAGNNKAEEIIKKLSEENIKVTESKDNKESVKLQETAEKISKDTVKQTDVLTAKDIKKEFKAVNVEVSESLRGIAQEKAEAKANSVNLMDTSKGNANNNTQKEFTVMQNKAGENVSASNQEKGNNFNYFLKSNSEASAKFETAQAREAATPYNVKDVRDIERLVRTMHSSVSKGQSKLTVVLTPENLGKLQIQLSETGGKITAKFLSDNEQSHKLIMAQSDMLKNQLSEKGIVIDNMEFAFNDTMSKGQSGDEQGKRAGRQSQQKGRNIKDNGNDLEVGIEVANKKTSGIYA